MFIKNASFSLPLLAVAALCAGAAHAADAVANGSPSISAGFACPPGMQWSTSTPPACVPTMGGTESPIPCNGGAVSWAGAPGVTCQGSVPAALNGVLKTISSTNTSSGSASFTCSNGTWTQTGASNCTAAPCGAARLIWTANGYTCSGTAVSTTAGSSANVYASGATQGSANFSCSVTGQWGAANPGATCVPGNCAAGAVPSWGSGGFVVGGGSSANCSGPALPAGTPGQSVTLTDSTAPYTGSASFTCSNGTWQKTDENCVQQTGCPYTASVSWIGPSFGGGSASPVCYAGPLSAGTSGQQVQLTNTASGVSGTAAYTCSNGVWTRTGGSCATVATPPASCPTQNLSWSVGGVLCNGTVYAGTGGTYVYDNAAPTTGSTYATCANGYWGVLSGYATCTQAAPPAPPAPTSCPAGTFSWVASGNTCSAYVTATASGSTATLVDTTAPATGSAYVTCSGGAWGAPYGGSCNQAVMPPPVPAGCAAADAPLPGYGGFRYVLKAAQSGASFVINMSPPFIQWTTSNISGAGTLYGLNANGVGAPAYCAGQASATCTNGAWSVQAVSGAAPSCMNVCGGAGQCGG